MGWPILNCKENNLAKIINGKGKLPTNNSHTNRLRL